MKKESKEKRTVIILAAGICLFLLLLFQCRKYALQNQELLVENAELSETLEIREATINAMAEELDRLQALFAEEQPYETETGYIREGSVYYIDSGAQLQQLKQMIEERSEIEPGVLAAEASYQLRQNLKMKDWFYLGTEEAPFCGSFDGDGHSISGKFPFRNGMDIPAALFRTSSSAAIENIQVINEMDRSFQNVVTQSVENQEECGELMGNLAGFPNCGIRLSVSNGDFDTWEIAEELRDRWERNQEQEGYLVSIKFCSDPEQRDAGENYLQDVMTPFNGVAGEEYRAVIEEAMQQEGGYLTYIQLKRIGTLNCCSFELGEWDRENPREEGSADP